MQFAIANIVINRYNWSCEFQNCQLNLLHWTCNSKYESHGAQVWRPHKKKHNNLQKKLCTWQWTILYMSTPIHTVSCPQCKCTYDNWWIQLIIWVVRFLLHCDITFKQLKFGIYNFIFVTVTNIGFAQLEHWPACFIIVNITG